MDPTVQTNGLVRYSYNSIAIITIRTTESNKQFLIWISYEETFCRSRLEKILMINYQPAEKGKITGVLSCN